MDFPQRTAHYEGPLTTTAIWDKFQLRSDDVLVITPPKCGTTWSQIIVTSLIAGRPLSPREMGDVSYWLDCALDDPVANMEAFDKQGFRRCIKSHTPLDGVPYDPSSTYIAVYRHPIDVHFSMRTHAGHMESDVMRRRYPDDGAEAFRMFLEDEPYEASNDALDLHSIAYHFASFKKWEHLPNVHLFHYADMKADLAGTVARFSRILGMDDSDPLVGEVAQGTSFASLKKKAIEGDKTAEGDGFYLASKFFDSGTSNKWEGKLSDDQLAAFDARMKELLPKDQAAWLLWGSKGRP